MSKIVQAANAMIANPDAIDSVCMGEDGELFFLYAKKYKWSIRVANDNEINLFYYPGTQSIKDLARFAPDDWQDFTEMVTYSSRDIGTKEARATFFELYTLLKERLWGVNKALDDIIGLEY